MRCSDYQCYRNSLVLPNVDVAGAGTVTLAGTPNNKRSQFLRDWFWTRPAGVTVATAGLLTLATGDCCRMNNAGVLDKVPTFAGASICNIKSGNHRYDKEMPASVRNLYVSNATGIQLMRSCCYSYRYIISADRYL